jgi:hypothetical protein
MDFVLIINIIRQHDNFYHFVFLIAEALKQYEPLQNHE